MASLTVSIPYCVLHLLGKTTKLLGSPELPDVPLGEWGSVPRDADWSLVAERMWTCLGSQGDREN